MLLARMVIAGISFVTALSSRMRNLGEPAGAALFAFASMSARTFVKAA